MPSNSRTHIPRLDENAVAAPCDRSNNSHTEISNSPKKCSSHLHDSKRITVLFRCDDYSSLSDTDFERKLIKVFAGHRCPVTFAVIPYVSNPHVASEANLAPVIALDSEKADILREAMSTGTVEVAQHGYSHTFVNGQTWRGEFIGLDHSEQFRRILAGRRLLGDLLGQAPDVFVPPNNKYDAITAQVLLECCFRVLSSDYLGGPAARGSLSYVPKTCNLTDFWTVIERTRQLHDPRPLVVVLFHNFDFQEEQRHFGTFTLTDLEKIVSWAVQQPDIRIRTFAQILQEGRDFSAERYSEAQKLVGSGLAKYLPNQLRTLFESPAFPIDAADLQHMRKVRLLIFAGFWLFAMLVTVLLGYSPVALCHRGIPVSGLFVLLEWVGLCVICNQLFRKSSRRFKIAVSLYGLLGLVAGAMIAAFR